MLTVNKVTEIFYKARNKSELCLIFMKLTYTKKSLQL